LNSQIKDSVYEHGGCFYLDPGSATGAYFHTRDNESSVQVKKEKLTKGRRIKMKNFFQPDD
jgi:hypothetical protein